MASIQNIKLRMYGNDKMQSNIQSKSQTKNDKKLRSTYIAIKHSLSVKTITVSISTNPASFVL